MNLPTRILVAFLLFAPIASAAEPSAAATREIEERRGDLEHLVGHLRGLQNAAKPLDFGTDRRIDLAMKQLHDALVSKDTHVRDAVVNDLLNSHYLPFPADRIVSEILPLIETPEPVTGRMAEQGLLMEHLGVRYPQAAKQTVPPLLRMATNAKASTYLRGRALDALGRVGRGNADVLKALLAVAKDPKTDGNLTRDIVMILAAHGEKSDEVKTLLTDLCVKAASHDAFLALGKLSMDATPKPLAVYLDKLRDADKLPLGEAAAAFLHVQKHCNPTAAFRDPLTFAPPVSNQLHAENAKAARPVLLAIVKSRPDGLISRLALRVLEAVGPGSSKEAAQVLCDILLRPAEYNDALYALTQFDPTDSAAVPVFRSTFETVAKTDQWVKQVALARILARYGKDAAAAAPSVIAALRTVQITDNERDAYFETFAQYLETLVAIGGETAGVRDAILEHLAPKSKTITTSGKAVHHYRAKLLRTLAAVGLPTEEKARAEAMQHVTLGLLMDIDVVFQGATAVVARNAASITTDEAAMIVPQLTRVLAPNFAFSDATGKLMEAKDWKDLVRHRPMNEQIYAIEALGALGPKAKAALPVLQPLADLKIVDPLPGYLPPPPIFSVMKEAQRAVAAIEKK